MLNICEVFPIRKNLIRNFIDTPKSVFVMKSVLMVDGDDYHICRRIKNTVEGGGIFNDDDGNGAATIWDQILFSV